MPRVKEMGRYNLARPQLLPAFGSSVKSGGVESRPPKAGPGTPAVKPAMETRSAWKKVIPRFGRSNPFGSQPPAMVAVPQAEVPAQPELSLDKVKVVRNDLSESDIVVVTEALPGPATSSRRYMRTGAKPDDLGKKAWHLLGKRLFGRAATKP